MATDAEWLAAGHCPMYPGDPRCETVEQCGDCDDHGCAAWIMAQDLREHPVDEKEGT